MSQFKKNPSIPPSLRPSPRPSFKDAIKRAEEQVGYWEMKQRSDKLEYQINMDIVHELCGIMAEVYLMEPTDRIRISGEWIPVYVAQQVFGEVTQDHVQEVVSSFARLCCEIQNKKAYLRTMLYNIVFSLVAGIKNDTNVNW